MKPIQLFGGFDTREAVGYFTFCSSVIRRASRPVSITPVTSMGLTGGTNSFTTSRFLVPALCDFKGHAIFADSADMLCLSDIAELDAMFDPSYAVQVVQHPEYQSRHERKYIGTNMECAQSDYARKNWASVCIFNNEHPAWRGIDHEQLAGRPRLHFLQFQNLLDSEIGSLPPEWNVLIDEGQDDAGAKLIHFTAGVPSFLHYRNQRRSQDWFKEFERVTEGRQDG